MRRLRNWWYGACRTDYLAGVSLPYRVLHYAGLWPGPPARK
jgi:hypothetical protein